MLNYYAHSAVDTFQTGKKYFIDSFVQHDEVKQSLTKFVDAQTAYTKSAIDAGIQFGTSMAMLVASQKFYKDLTDSYKSFVPAYNVKSKSKKEK